MKYIYSDIWWKIRYLEGQTDCAFLSPPTKLVRDNNSEWKRRKNFLQVKQKPLKTFANMHEQNIYSDQAIRKRKRNLFDFFTQKKCQWTQKCYPPPTPMNINWLVPTEVVFLLIVPADTLHYHIMYHIVSCFLCTYQSQCTVPTWSTIHLP